MSTSRPKMAITGASRGIGAATAVAAAKAGWDVAMSYRVAAEEANSVADSCRDAGAEVWVCRVDIDQEASVSEFVHGCVEHLGGLDSLVNNAGIVTPIGTILDTSYEQLRKVFEVNVFGTFIAAREAVRIMSTANGGKGGSIINVSSAAAYLGNPNEFIDYAATKGAVDTLTFGLAKEVADQGIRVNAVRPGLIDTTMHADAGFADRVVQMAKNIPMQRGGQPEEVADAILYLASPQSSYITGALLNVSGGR